MDVTILAGLVEEELARHRLQQQNDGTKRCSCGTREPFGGSGVPAAAAWKRHQAGAIARDLMNRGVFE